MNGTYVMKIREANVVRSPVTAPVKACWSKIQSAESVEELKGILREAKPTNITEGASVGVMKTTLDKVCYTDISGQIFNVVTTSSDEAILSENATVVGESGKFVFIYDGKTDTYRRCYKSTTHFVIGE